MDRRARFDVLARDTYAPLYRYLRRRADPAIVDDVLADTLLVMWRRVDDIPDDAQLAWCYGVARGCLANARRAEGRQRNLLRRLAAQPHPCPEPVWAAADPDVDRALEVALTSLPATDREVLRLWAWEQLEPREIALALGITANAASIRLHRAVKRLRQRLTSTDGAAPDTARKDREPPGHVGRREGTEARGDR